MQNLKCAKPATAYGEPASGIEQLGGPLDTSHTPSAIIAQLVGSDLAVVDAIKGKGAFDLCRRLLANGYDPESRLVCFRGGQIALTINSLRTGALFTVRETASDGPRVVAWKAFPDRDVSTPMRQNDGVAS
jgi:hypothetical protein